MICLPEEPELVRFGEDHKGLSPTNCSIFNGTGNFEGRELQKRPYIFNNDNGARIKLLNDKSLSDMSAQFSSSPSPPTITASSASSAISSAGNSMMKNKPPTGKRSCILNPTLIISPHVVFMTPRNYSDKNHFFYRFR